MKKSTLLLLLLAVLAGGLTWYFEVKHPPKQDLSSSTLSPAFSFQPADVVAVDVQRAGENVLVERQKDGWQVVQPVNTRADQSVMDGLTGGVSSAVIERKLSAAPDRLLNYGLTSPAVTVKLKLRNGSQHRLALGSKSFNGSDVYAQVDNAPDVYLFSSSLLAGADKGLHDLRDNAVLDFRSPDVTSFQIRNSHGDFSLTKHGDEWQFETPAKSYADDSKILELLSQMETSRIGAIVSENSAEAAKYGLKSPSITFTVRDKDGKSYILLVGKKNGENYYAQDVSRGMVFLIPASVYQKLDVDLPDLRDKRILHLSQDQLSRVEIHNANQTVACVSQGDKWIIRQPPAQAGKEAMTWKFLLPLLNARAVEVLDHPSSAVSASLAKPAIDVTLTPKSGQTIHVLISQPDGPDVYAEVSQSGALPGFFKMEKEIYDELNFSAADVVMSAPGSPASH